MKLLEAWAILENHLEPDAGYECDEVIEMQAYIERYNDAIDMIEKLVKEQKD